MREGQDFAADGRYRLFAVVREPVEPVFASAPPATFDGAFARASVAAF
ncbi:hypothetical protein ACIQPQ_33195 [Streptomyces sp. NPDC091281]